MNKIKFILGSLLGGLSLLPALAFAQRNFVADRGVSGFLTTLDDLMRYVVPILIGLAVIVFLWGVLTFVFNAGNDEKRTGGRMMMLWGIIGIAVMVSVWGLVGFVQNTFGVQRSQALPTPQLPY